MRNHFMRARWYQLVDLEPKQLDAELLQARCADAALVLDLGEHLDQEPRGKVVAEEAPSMLR